MLREDVRAPFGLPAAGAKSPEPPHAPDDEHDGDRDGGGRIRARHVVEPIRVTVHAKAAPDIDLGER